MLVGAWFVTQGDLSAGGFVGFLLLVNVFLRPIEKINSVIETYQKGIAGFQRYLDFLDQQPEIVDTPAAIHFERPEGNISHVAEIFGYQQDTPLIGGVSFTTKACRMVAFVGGRG